MSKEFILCMIFYIFNEGRYQVEGFVSGEGQLNYKQNPAPDGHRCGICPTYFQKICAHDLATAKTYIFDNHCIMDLFNCRKGSEFKPLGYNKCLYFGNFAYVHGYKYEDLDYDEENVLILGSKKNYDFLIKRK